MVDQLSLHGQVYNNFNPPMSILNADRSNFTEHVLGEIILRVNDVQIVAKNNLRASFKVNMSDPLLT